MCSGQLAVVHTPGSLTCRFGGEGRKEEERRLRGLRMQVHKVKPHPGRCMHVKSAGRSFMCGDMRGDMGGDMGGE